MHPREIEDFLNSGFWEIDPTRKATRAACQEVLARIPEEIAEGRVPLKGCSMAWALAGLAIVVFLVGYLPYSLNDSGAEKSGDSALGVRNGAESWLLDSWTVVEEVRSFQLLLR
jgi:hypothetical protein